LLVKENSNNNQAIRHTFAKYTCIARFALHHKLQFLPYTILPKHLMSLVLFVTNRKWINFLGDRWIHTQLLEKRIQRFLLSFLYCLDRKFGKSTKQKSTKRRRAYKKPCTFVLYIYIKSLVESLIFSVFINICLKKTWWFSWYIFSDHRVSLIIIKYKSAVCKSKTQTNSSL